MSRERPYAPPDDPNDGDQADFDLDLHDDDPAPLDFSDRAFDRFGDPRSHLTGGLDSVDDDYLDMDSWDGNL